MTLVALVLALFPYRELILVAGVVFGIGFGAFSNVEQVLATNVLPNKDDYGKDTGIWKIASILPQITGIVIGGLTLDFFRELPNHMGYSILMASTTVFFGRGTMLVQRSISSFSALARRNSNRNRQKEIIAESRTTFH